jgi:hypothetical protein
MFQSDWDHRCTFPRNAEDLSTTVLWYVFRPRLHHPHSESFTRIRHLDGSCDRK